MTPKKTQRAVRRRARQNKSPSNPFGRGQPLTETWNVLADPTPGLTRVQTRDNAFFTFRQLVDVGNILTSSAGAATFYGTAFNLSSFPQVTSIQNLFDQYRIDWLDVLVCPSGGVTTDANQKLLTAVDYDSSATPGSINQLLTYQNVMETNCTTGHRRQWKPHVGFGVGFPTTTIQGMANIVSPWIDCLTPGVNHNALVLGMTATSSTCVLSLRVSFTISVRNVF